MIKWYYRLFREAEGMNDISSVMLTTVNLLCGAYKKIVYRNQIKQETKMRNLRITPQKAVVSLWAANASSKERECLTSSRMAS